MSKIVNYSASNTYDTLNKLTSKTERVWLVFHGIGYLSRYFVRCFNSLDPEKNYFIAPQAPSKYYKDNRYKNVGACWLTKENTKTDTDTILQYVDAVIANENIPKNLPIHVLGYSQGVSIASRWVAQRTVNCNALVLISGEFPKELQANHFNFFTPKTKIIHVVGTKDPYFERKNVSAQIDRLRYIFPDIDFRYHDGGHDIDIESIRDLF